MFYKEETAQFRYGGLLSWFQIVEIVPDSKYVEIIVLEIDSSTTLPTFIRKEITIVLNEDKEADINGDGVLDILFQLKRVERVSGVAEATMRVARIGRAAAEPPPERPLVSEGIPLDVAGALDADVTIREEDGETIVFRGKEKATIIEQTGLAIGLNQEGKATLFISGMNEGYILEKSGEVIQQTCLGASYFTKSKQVVVGGVKYHVERKVTYDGCGFKQTLFEDRLLKNEVKVGEDASDSDTYGQIYIDGTFLDEVLEPVDISALQGHFPEVMDELIRRAEELDGNPLRDSRVAGIPMLSSAELQRRYGFVAVRSHCVEPDPTIAGDKGICFYFSDDAGERDVLEVEPDGKVTLRRRYEAQELYALDYTGGTPMIISADPVVLATLAGNTEEGKYFDELERLGVLKSGEAGVLAVNIGLAYEPVDRIRQRLQEAGVKIVSAGKVLPDGVSVLEDSAFTARKEELKEMFLLNDGSVLRETTEDSAVIISNTNRKELHIEPDGSGVFTFYYLDGSTNSDLLKINFDQGNGKWLDESFNSSLLLSITLSEEQRDSYLAYLIMAGFFSPGSRFFFFYFVKF